MKYRNILLSCIAAGALVIAVGACTHSSDDSNGPSTSDQTDPRDDRIAELEGELEGEKKRADDAEGKLADQATAADAANARALFSLLGTAAPATGEINRTSYGDPTDTSTVHTRPDPADAMKDGNDESKKLMMGSPVLVTSVIGAGGMLPDIAALNGRSGTIKISGFARTTGSRAYADGARVSGTVSNVPGIFTCGSGCSISVASSDTTDPSETKKIEYAFAGTWSFQANNPNGQVPSMDHLEFGWWKIAPSDGAPTGVGVFVTASGFTQVNTISGVTGSAKYAGSATGKYAVQDEAGLVGTTISGDGIAEAGAFTADAELTAKFSAEETSLEGMLTNFMTDNGESRDWMVALQSANLASTTFAGRTVWTANGKAASASGENGWSARFFNDGNAAGVPGVTDNAPTHVGGTFESTYGSVGRMLGAFGAERE